MWLKSYEKTDTSQVIKSISGTALNNMLVLEQKDTGSKIKLFDSNGNILGVKEIFGSMKLENAISSQESDIILISNGDLIMIRFASLTAL